MSKNISIFAAASLALAACQSIPDTKGDTGGLAPYKALGTEPFWSLNIDRDKMRFEHEGVVSVDVKDVKTRPSFNGWRYSSARITADVTFTPCSDGMSELTYKDTVTVMVGKQEYKGCGGGVIAPEKLDGTSWQIVSINNANIPTEREAMLRFEDGRMSGTVGCNRLGGAYQFAEGKLGIGPVMSTKMACPDPVGQQEYAFISVLGNLGTTEFPGDGTMVLTAKDGSRIVLRQSI